MITLMLKQIFYLALAVLGIYRLWRFLHRREALILTYHGVLQNGRDVYTNRNCVDAEMFDRQMAYLARHYHVLPLPDLVRHLRDGKKLPLYSAAITFDDGFLNNFSVAWPILKKYQLPATIFLAASYIDSDKAGLWTEQVDCVIHSAREKIHLEIDGSPKTFRLRSHADREIASDMIRAYLKRLPPPARERAITALLQQAGVEMNGHCKSLKAAGHSLSQTTLAQNQERYAFLNWRQVWKMAQDQITFGSHTLTHSIVSTLSDAEAQFEMNESRRMIEQNSGKPCNLFSYPNGTPKDFGGRDQNLLRKLGYVAAVSQISGFNDGRTDLMALRRINIVRDRDFNFFLAKISGVWTKLKNWI
jgi:peptidoglycan/xylan/chitin deacetylase (PgdA/CDA1 family)